MTDVFQPATDMIGYDDLLADAMRYIPKCVLERVKREGWPGDHHAYITVQTNARGVEIPTDLRAKFPESMTIVIQHQYERLEVTDTEFSVTLLFGGVPKRLVIPWDAMRRYFDPSIGALYEWPMEEPDVPALEVAQAATVADNVVRPTFGKRS